MGWFGRCVLVATALSLTVAGSAAATFPGKNGKISFNRFVEADETFKLFTTTPSGAPPRLVTDFGRGVSAVLADWSPNGRKLAIDSDRSGQPQIWILDRDGSRARRLTDASEGALDPAWTPNGRKLAVEADFGDGTGIFLIPARRRQGELVTGDRARRVTRPPGGGFDSEPQVSPDGRWIVFTRYSVECTDDATFERCTTRLFRVRRDGSRLQRLTRPALNASAPDYHPSGRWIAFDTHDNDIAPDAGHIMVMRPDGSGKRVIVRGDEDDFFNNPSFSPNGRRVSFARWGAADAEPAPRIWVARADGRNPHRLLGSPTGDNKPDWGPRPRRRR